MDRDPSFYRGRLPVTLEKWYIDAILDDGAVLLVYLARLSVLGVPLARVTADLFGVDGSRRSGSAAARGAEGGPGALRFGPAVIEGKRLTFETSELSGDLVYHPRYPGCELLSPFLEEGGRLLRWNVEIPDADVEGTLRAGTKTLAVRGRGYRDHVAFDLVPWRFPIGALTWGRAVAGPHAAIWVHASTKQGDVRAAWKDGQAVGDSGKSPPGDAPKDTPVQGVTLRESRLLVDADVLDLDGLRLGRFRPLLARVAGHPHERKLAASCAIDDASGFAIHEIVTWRRS